MNLIEALVLGIIQGLTEFLPVSSSGHLVIFQNIFGISAEDIAFEVVVHLGTLTSVVVVFYSDILNMIKSLFKGIYKPREAYIDNYYFKLAIFIIIGTIPAVVAGLFLKDFFESIFHNAKLVGVTLLITAGILWSTKFINNINKPLSMGKSALIGVGQALAIFPGISRSGTTISASLILGIPRAESAKFSFLLSVPAILGAAVLELKEFVRSGIELAQLSNLITGFISSFIIGYIAIRFLLDLIRKGKFHWFAPYCLIIGILVLILL